MRVGVICPRCEGAGGIPQLVVSQIFSQFNYLFVSRSKRRTCVKIQCGCCMGKGRVSERTSLLYEQARAAGKFKRADDEE